MNVNNGCMPDDNGCMSDNHGCMNDDNGCMNVNNKNHTNKASDNNEIKIRMDKTNDNYIDDLIIQTKN